MTTSFGAAWLSGDRRALTLLGDDFRRLGARSAAVTAAVERPVRPEVIAALVRGHAALAPSVARDRHLAALATPGTTVAVTGQQVGLFLGPLYTIYKAATAIAVARALAEETGRPCVPIFWLQTEDHDFTEIKHCSVPRAAGEALIIAVDDAEGGTARVPVAHRVLGASIDSALDTLEAELAGWPHAPELMDLLRASYVAQASPVAAFAQLIATLFADDGLLLLDPRDPALAALAAPVHRACLENAAELSTRLQQRSAELLGAGFEPQVHIRPGSPLCFYAPDGADGPRYRLDPTAEAWRLVGDPLGRCVTTQEILAWAAREPLRLSSSALSRPLVQDTLLPTAAYVGGPGEVAYFAQLGPAYQAFGLPMPLVVPRARFRVVDAHTGAALAKLGLFAHDLSRPRTELLAQLTAQAGNQDEAPLALSQRLLAGLDTELDVLAPRMAALDPNFDKSVARTRTAIHEAVAKLLDKYARALGQRDQSAVDRLDRARAFLQPGGEPQERVLGWPYFAARFGPHAFVRMVVAQCAPFSGALEDLTP